MTMVAAGGSVVRGFALYVGLSEEKARAAGLTLDEVISAAQHEVTAAAPSAEVHVAIAIAPAGSGGDDLDTVRRAFGEPASVARARERALELPGLVIDITRNAVRIDRSPIRLTGTEFHLLEQLVRQPGSALSRQQLHEGLRGVESISRHSQDRTIDVHMSRLRRKLDHFGDVIRTVPGLGYRYDRYPDVSVLEDPLPALDWRKAR